MTFRGTGSAWIPARQRFIRFVDGIYTTIDDAEVACLAASFPHDPEREDCPAIAALDPERENAPIITPEREKPKRGRPRNA